jgi:hypothetical protein
MKITVTKLRQLGKFDEKYKVWRQTEAEEKRKDIDPKKLYLTSYSGAWLIGRFEMEWYGWNFIPNMGSMTMQIEWLKEIYEIKGLPQKIGGSTSEHILGYLKEDKDED